MTMRERHGLTLTALDSIHRNTGIPYRLIYADNRIPPWLREELSRRAEDWHLEILEVEAEAVWPNQIRKQVAPLVGTPYVVFLDSDVWVAPGWLESLIACADETGAGIVCPIYLIGDAGSATKIHMAGGGLAWLKDAAGTLLREESRLKDQEFPSVASSLRREPCDFAEYHCVLMRTDLAKQANLFDERIVCVHEHIDTALTAREAGHAVYFEPAAHVTYMPFELQLSDLATYRSRWEPAAVESSIKAFCAKWGVIDDWRCFGAIRLTIDAHRAQQDPLRPGASAGSAADRAMQPHELRQTLSGLFEIAQSRGFIREEWDMIEMAHRLALVLMNGAYRPCGRPFINHLIGTASVLAHFNFRARLIGAALLHAAYTHGIDAAADVEAGIERIRKLLGGQESRLEASVLAYALRFQRWQRLAASPRWPLELSIEDAEILAIAAANEADMHLSGEFRFSGRRDLEIGAAEQLMTHACTTLGVPGLGETLRAERQTLLGVPAKPDSRMTAAFRIVGDRLVPAVNTAAIEALQRSADPTSARP